MGHITLSLLPSVSQHPYPHQHLSLISCLVKTRICLVFLKNEIQYFPLSHRIGLFCLQSQINGQVKHKQCFLILSALTLSNIVQPFLNQFFKIKKKCLHQFKAPSTHYNASLDRPEFQRVNLLHLSKQLDLPFSAFLPMKWSVSKEKIVYKSNGQIEDKPRR